MSEITLSTIPNHVQKFLPFQNRLSIISALIFPISLFLLWFIASNQHWMPSQILPTPQETLLAFKSLVTQDQLFQQIGISLSRLLFGLFIGTLFGLFFGTFLGYSKRFEQYVAPTFFALAIIPTLAWLPLLIIWLGIEDALKIFLIFKASFIPIAIHTQSGIRDLNPQLREISQTLRLSKFHTFWKLLLPSALPHFFIGLRTALSAAWTTLIAVELIASSEGIGYLMVYGRQLFQLDIVFVCIAIIGIIGFILDFILNKIEKNFIVWPHTALSVHHNHHKSKFSIKPFLIPLVIFLFWFWSTQTGVLDKNVLSHPRDVLTAILHGISDGSITSALLQSLYRAFLGLIIGGSLGVIIGLILGLHPRLSHIFSPTLNTLRLIAIFAWIPLITAWFGLGDLAKIIFISIATFFPIFVATLQGTFQVPKNLIEAAQSLKLTYWQRLVKLVIPSIVPTIFSGFRLSLLYAWMASFGVEYLMGSGSGIGIYMITAQQNFDIDQVLAATFFVAILGLVFAWLGQKAEQLASAWRHSGESK
ncbi:MAG: ABC transporter permease [Acinetobacter sp.]